MRPSKREANALRPIHIQRNFTKHAEGSVLVCYGDTQVICTASLVEGVPRFLKGKGQAWLTAEYGMLPRATSDRTQREAVSGKQGGRSSEIQRLIGRSLRSAVNLNFLPEYTVAIDCDVIQADGGTRTAAITGACVALADALSYFKSRNLIKSKMQFPHPLQNFVAAVSVGVYKGQVVLDLDYAEDSNAETDMNVVMNDAGGFIEIQGTAEGKAFTETEFQEMLSMAKAGIAELIVKQKEALHVAGVKDLPWG